MKIRNKPLSIVRIPNLCFSLTPAAFLLCYHHCCSVLKQIQEQFKFFAAEIYKVWYQELRQKLWNWQGAVYRWLCTKTIRALNLKYRCTCLMCTTWDCNNTCGKEQFRMELYGLIRLLLLHWSSHEFGQSVDPNEYSDVYSVCICNSRGNLFALQCLQTYQVITFKVRWSTGNSWVKFRNTHCRWPTKKYASLIGSLIYISFILYHSEMKV